MEDAAAPICGYLVEAEIHGPDVKQAYEIAKKGATLNAAYPGFRKGVIPPHALQDVKINAVTVRVSCVYLSGWMDGWMDKWMDGWMDGWCGMN